MTTDWRLVIGDCGIYRRQQGGVVVVVVVWGENTHYIDLTALLPCYALREGIMISTKKK